MFVDSFMAELTGKTRSTNAAVLWFVLFRLADGKSGLIRGASLPRLARLTGLSRRTVWAAVQALLREEFLFVHKQGVGQVPVYRLDHAHHAGMRDVVTNGQPV